VPGELGGCVGLLPTGEEVPVDDAELILKQTPDTQYVLESGWVTVAVTSTLDVESARMKGVNNRVRRVRERNMLSENT
jgi:hypothetical protein